MPQFRLLQSRLRPTQEAAVWSGTVGEATPSKYPRTVNPTQSNTHDKAQLLPLALGLGDLNNRRVAISTSSSVACAGHGGDKFIHGRTQQAATPGGPRRPVRSPLVLSFLVQPSDHFRRFFPLGYPPPLRSYEIKPSHSTASLTMKKGGFSFSAAGGPTPRDDSARSDRKENALPGAEVPPLSPTQQSGWWGGTDPSRVPVHFMQRYSDSMHLYPHTNKHLFILRSSSYRSGILTRL